MLSYVNDFRHPRLTLVQSTTTVIVYHKLLTFHILLYRLSRSVEVVPDMTNQSVPLTQPSKVVSDMVYRCTVPGVTDIPFILRLPSGHGK